MNIIPFEFLHDLTYTRINCKKKNDKLRGAMVWRKRSWWYLINKIAVMQNILTLEPDFVLVKLNGHFLNIMNAHHFQNFHKNRTWFVVLFLFRYELDNLLH